MNELATMILVHHKNERWHGREVVPLAPELVEAFRMLDRAAQVLGSPTLFFRENDREDEEALLKPFDDVESSHYSIRLLSGLLDSHLTAT